MSRKQAIDRIAESEQEIRALGVGRLALLGSVVRDEARADSDVDMLVEFVPGAKSYGRGLFLEGEDLAELGVAQNPVVLATLELAAAA